MATKTTRWRPDHCACELEFTWDEAVAQASRTHTFSKDNTRCTIHSALTGSTLFNTVLEENQRKNIALQIALDNGPSTLYDLSGTTRILKPAITYNYAWTGAAPNRVLTMSFIGVSLTTTNKNTIQTAENTRFGTGKVAVL